ncbi:MAG: hypothetical protein HW389_273 [Bacteroidetes bacterium]|nr:hypothetical protein [Bacteroidota bacterium]
MVTDQKRSSAQTAELSAKSAKICPNGKLEQRYFTNL